VDPDLSPARPEGGSRRRRERWKAILARALLATIVPLVLLEAVLQAGAWIVSRWADRGRDQDPPATSADGNGDRLTVLCIGDSYTWGIGADDPQKCYPARLEADLRAATGRAWRVENGGWPGRDSGQALRALPAQLDRVHPAVVCMLVGINDFWSHPKLATVATVGSSEHHAAGGFEPRTLRLVKLIRHAWSERASAPTPLAAAPADPPFVGVWMSAGGVCRFDRDGRFFGHGGDGRWILRDAVIRVDDGGQPPFDLRFEMKAQDTLELATSGADRPTTFVRAHPWPTALAKLSRPRDAHGDAALAALAQQEFARAVPEFEAALAGHPGHPAFELGIVNALVGLGRRDEAERHFDRMRAELAHAPGKALAEACLRMRLAITRGERTVALARELSAAFPTSVAILEILATEATTMGDVATARPAIERALSLTPDGDPIRKAELHRWRDALLRRVDPREALRSTWVAYTLDGDRDRTLGELRLIQSLRGRPWMEATLGELDLGKPASAALAALLEQSAQGDDSVPGVLESHLQQMIALCERQHARVLLLDYPTRLPAHEEIVRHLADRRLVMEVGVTEFFERLFATHARAEFLNGDGHCNDAGYDVVAQATCDALLR